jgi:hypothetical protein
MRTQDGGLRALQCVFGQRRNGTEQARAEFAMEELGE